LLGGSLQILLNNIAAVLILADISLGFKYLIHKGIIISLGLLVILLLLLQLLLLESWIYRGKVIILELLWLVPDLGLHLQLLVEQRWLLFVARLVVLDRYLVEVLVLGREYLSVERHLVFFYLLETVFLRQFLYFWVFTSFAIIIRVFSTRDLFFQLDSLELIIQLDNITFIGFY